MPTKTPVAKQRREVNLAILTPPDLVDRIDEIAKAERRSRRQQVIILLQEAVESHGTAAAMGPRSPHGGEAG